MGRIFPAMLLLVISPSLLGAQTPRFLARSTNEWIKDLGAAQPSVRRGAAFALGRMGVNALHAIPVLVRRLETDKDAGVREMAATALGDIVKTMINGRGHWDEVGPALMQALADTKDPRVRCSAAYGLGCFGPAAVPGRDGLIAALKDDDASVRQNAAWALGQFGAEAGADVVRDLIPRLKDSEILVRRDAAAALGAIGQPHAHAALRPLIELAKAEPDEVVVKTTLATLVKVVEPSDREAIRDLSPLLRRPDPETARLAAIVIANIGGPEAILALPLLRQTLRDPEPGMPSLGAAAIAGLGTGAAPALDDIVLLLKESKDPQTRRNALLALGAMEVHAAKALDIIVQALQVDNPRQVRLYAMYALSQIAYPHNEKALPAVLTIIRKDSDADVRHRGIWTLFKLEELEKVPGAIQALAATLDEKDKETALVRYEAARVLALRLRDKAPDRTVDVLLEMLNDKTLLVHKGIGTKVSGVGTETAQGQSEVRENSQGDGRYMAAEGLGWLGKKAADRPEVMKTLGQFIKDPDTRLREKASQALESLRKVGG